MTTAERIRAWVGSLPTTGGELRPQELARREYDSHTETKQQVRGDALARFNLERR